MKNIKTLILTTFILAACTAHDIKSEQVTDNVKSLGDNTISGDGWQLKLAGGWEVEPVCKEGGIAFAKDTEGFSLALNSEEYNGSVDDYVSINYDDVLSSTDLIDRDKFIGSDNREYSYLDYYYKDDRAVSWVTVTGERAYTLTCKGDSLLVDDLEKCFDAFYSLSVTK